MTPSACVMIRRCAGLLAARRLRAVRLHRARWAASRRNGSRHPRTSVLLPICPASGSTLCGMAASNAWVLSDVSSSATTTVSAVLRAELHLARDRRSPASVFGPLLLTAYSISLDLSKRDHPLAAGSASLETALSARASLLVPARP